MEDIDSIRNEIDKITQEIIILFKKRLELSQKIGVVKKDAGREIIDNTREEQLFSKMQILSSEIGLNKASAGRLVNFLINESVRVQSIKNNTHLSIFYKAKEMEKNGKDIIHMEVGEPDFMAPKSLQNALSDAYKLGFTKYGMPQGDPLLLEELAKKHKVMPENILITHGGRFAVFAAITTLLDPGDEVIIIEPAWPAYRQCAEFAGVKTKMIKTTMEKYWEPSLDDIRKVTSSNTKMIILNYPNNPTGKILSCATLDGIVNLAKENDWYILSDEVYSTYAYTTFKSILEYNYEKSIVVNSFSKSHAMTGFRIGYTITHKDLVQKMVKLQELCITSVSEPIQYAAMNAINQDTSNNPKIIKSRMNEIIKVAKKANLKFTVPDGAMYLFLDMEENGSELADSLLEKGLAVAPGEGFGEYTNFVRISLCSDVKKLISGMKILIEK